MTQSRGNRASWNTRLSAAEHQTSERGALRLYEALDTPVSLSCYLLLKHKEYTQLIEKRVDPLQYQNASSFKRDYQAVSYLSKFPDFPTGIDKDAVALGKFLEAESICRQTNRRLKARASGVFSTPDVESVLFLAQRKIAHILGRWRPSYLLDGGFGPGVTSSCRGSKTGLSEKFSSELDATRDALKYLKPLIGCTPLWSKAIAGVEPFGPDFSALIQPTIVDADRITFVPKNAKTNRTITVAATLNMFFQKAIGDVIRTRLKRCGVDLNSQLRNQTLARDASVTGRYATVDLSSASDTVSRELVWDLLPYDWSRVMDDVRHKRGRLPDGQTISYEKWSAMGNGYTFELESLIFYALAVGASQYVGVEVENIGVYGDDIIIPVEAYELFVRVLDYTGFVTNKDKTYSSGYFRESCGADWFFGCNVRPIFLKERIIDVGSTIRAANALRRIIQTSRGLVCEPLIGATSPIKASNAAYDLSVRSRFWSVWQFYVNRVPKEARIFIPEGYGDLGLVGNESESSTFKVDQERGYHRYTFLALLQVGAKYRNSNASATLIQSLKSSTGSRIVTDGTGTLIDRLLVKGSKLLKPQIVLALQREYRSTSPTNGLSSERRRVHYVKKHIVATEWPELEG